MGKYPDQIPRKRTTKYIKRKHMEGNNKGKNGKQ